MKVHQWIDIMSLHKNLPALALFKLSGAFGF